MNIPWYCLECTHCQSCGEVMVGTDETGGGPEESYKCSKGWNMGYFWWHDREKCPDCDHGEG